MWHPTYSLIVTFTVCLVIRGAAFQGSHGNVTTTLTLARTPVRVLPGKSLSPGDTELATVDSFPPLRVHRST